MDKKNLESSERLNELLAGFAEKTPKQMRTVRNNLNNRITSLEAEFKLGKAAPALSKSHMLYDFDLGECRKLLEAAKKVIKTQK